MCINISTSRKNFICYNNKVARYNNIKECDGYFNTPTLPEDRWYRQRCYYIRKRERESYIINILSLPASQTWYITLCLYSLVTLLWFLKKRPPHPYYCMQQSVPLNNAPTAIVFIVTNEEVDHFFDKLFYVVLFTFEYYSKVFKQEETFEEIS